MELSQPYVKTLATLPVTSDTQFEELYKIDDVSISAVNKGTGSQSTGIAIFAAALYSVINFFGDENWSDSQIIETATVFYEQCYWFCLPELKHFTRKCKALEFGKVYGRFNTATFMEWVSLYAAMAWARRTPHFEQKFNDNSVNWVEPAKEDLVPDEVVEKAIKDFESEIAAINEQEQKEAEERIRESSRMRKQIDAYMELVKKTTQTENNEP